MTFASSRIVLALAAAFAVVHLAFGLLPGAFEPWNLKATDALHRLRGEFGYWPAAHPDLAYVELRDEDLEALESPYFSREDYAELVVQVAEGQTKLQVHDATFLAPTGTSADGELVEAVADAGNVVLGYVAGIGEREATTDVPAWPVRIEGDVSAFPAVSRKLPAFPALNEAAAGMGFLDVEEDMDGVVRRALLLARGPDGGLCPSLPFQGACRVLGVEPDQILVVPGEAITLENARDGEDIVIPIDDRGFMRLDFVGPWSAMVHNNVALMLDEDPAMLERLIGGRVVLVADISTGSGDMGTVPIEQRYPKPGVQMAVLNGILTGHFLRDVGLAPMIGIELLFLAVLAWLATRRSTPWFLGGALLLVASFLVTAALLFFHAGLVLHLVRPLLILFVATAAVWAYRHLVGEKEKAVLQRSFEAYFPPNLVKRLVARPGLLTNAGRREELTILFSDIVGFTSMSSVMRPEDVHSLLNEYFESMVEAAFEEGGTVDKFIGDGLMVFFGDPEAQADHAARGVRAAVAMQRRVAALNARWEREGRQTIQIRIGLNSGPVLVGNMGSSKRLSYTVLGAAVNIAARFESGAPVGGVLISERTHELLGGAVDTRPVEPIKAKGYDDPIAAHTVPIES